MYKWDVGVLVSSDGSHNKDFVISFTRSIFALASSILTLHIPHVCVCVCVSMCV